MIRLRMAAVIGRKPAVVNVFDLPTADQGALRL